MQATSIASPSAPAAGALTEQQRHRLTTANLIIKSLAGCNLRVFGMDDQLARLDVTRLGAFSFVPSEPGASVVRVEGPVTGQERLLPGFTGSYAEQRLVRCLVTYVREGRGIRAAMLAQAFMANGNKYFDQVEDRFTKVMDEFRFTKAFIKPVEINRKTGPAA